MFCNIQPKVPKQPTSVIGSSEGKEAVIFPMTKSTWSSGPQMSISSTSFENSKIFFDEDAMIDSCRTIDNM